MRALAGGLAAAALLAMSSLTAASQSSWTTATMANPTNTTAAGSLAFTHTYPTGTCAGGPAATAALSCAGSVVPGTPTVASPGSTVVDTITNNGSITPDRLLQTVSVPSCAPVKLQNDRATANPMLPRHSTSFREPGPTKWTTGSASIRLNGSPAYAAAVVGTSLGSIFGSAYSMGTWFKVPAGSTTGGGLLSLDASPTTGTSTAASPVLWLDGAGKVRYRFSGTLGTSSSGASPASYNDGAWHHAVLSVNTFLGLTTPTLFVDGASVSSGLGVTALTGGGTAYWHLGWADFTGIPSAPPSAFLNGWLAGSYTEAAATNAAKASSLFNATTPTAYASALPSASNLWMLLDTGLTTYTGPHPVIGSTSPCTMVDLGFTVSGSSGTTTIAPKPLSQWTTPQAVIAPNPGASQTATAQTYRDATYNSYVTGLYLLAPVRWSVTTNPASATWQLTFSWDRLEGRFIA